MAENILGILFVVSTSRGRTVFRYPPDPLSPSARLSQPIYPLATYTAPDALPSARRKTPLDILDGREGRKSSNTSLRSSQRYSRIDDGVGVVEAEEAFEGIGEPWHLRPRKRSSGAGINGDGRRRSSAALAAAGGRRRSSPDADDGEGDSSASDESEYDYIYFGNGAKDETSPTATVNGREHPESDSRRGSADERDHKTIKALAALSHAHGASASASGGGGGSPISPKKDIRPKLDRDHGASGSGASGGRDRDVENQYSSALTYSLDFLSDMLSPPRHVCHRRFELSVDELVFLGHPVSAGPTGKWSFPDEDEDRPTGRGRKGRAAVKDTHIHPHSHSHGPGHGAHAHGASHLRTVVEAGEISPDTRSNASQDGDREDSKSEGGEKDDGPPILYMFHLVIILDKPDPTLASQADGHGSDPFDEVYKEIVFKWTAAVWALQVRDNFVARESWECARVRDKCLNEGMPIVKCCQLLYQSNPLERALCDLFYAIHKHQTSPVNPLYAHLPTTLTVPLADISVNMVLSPRTGASAAEEYWAHWGEMDADDSSDSESGESEDWVAHMLDPSRKTTTDLRVEPWQTLLLLDERAAERAGELAYAIVGSGAASVGGTAANSAVNTPLVDLQDSRRGSKETTAEEDESALMKALIEACDVTKPLAEMAHILRFDLDGIVIPLARELVQNKKAILIDVVNLRLRTMVMPTTIIEHDSTILEYAHTFAHYFPNAPPLPALMCQISSSTKPFRDALPDLSSLTDPIARQPYLDMLLWLMRRDLVVQVHTRARIFASREVKEIAWRRLWHRRRDRWLAHLAQSSRKVSSEYGLLSTSISGLASPRTPRPAAGTTSDPMDATATATAAATVPPPTHSQSQSQGDGVPANGARSHSPTPAYTPATHATSGSGTGTGMGGLRSMEQSFLDYDPDLEMDSDLGEGEGGGSSFADMWFSLDREEPGADAVPKFEGSFVFKPGRAQKDEARWLRVIREGKGEIWASKFDLCVQYFDGIATFEEISYRTGLPKRELDVLTRKYESSIITFLHP